MWRGPLIAASVFVPGRGLALTLAPNVGRGADGGNSTGTANAPPIAWPVPYSVSIPRPALEGDQALSLAANSKADVGHAYTFASTTAGPRPVDDEEEEDHVTCKRGADPHYMYDMPLPLGASVPEFASPRLSFAGGRSLPAESTWEHLWTNMVGEHDLDSFVSEGDVCRTPFLASAHVGFLGWGLGASMNHFVNEALVAMYLGRPLVLCAPEGQESAWSTLFEDPGFLRCKDSCRTDWGPGATSDLAQGGAVLSMDFADSRPLELERLKRFLYRKLFTPRKGHRQVAQSLQHDLGLAGAPYVGVHLRRGDKGVETLVSRETADFAAEAAALCDATGARTVFLSTDTSSELNRFRAALRDDIEVVAQPRLDGEGGAEGAYEGREGAGYTSNVKRTLMADLALLIGADAFVGTASSNLGRFVWFLREPSTQAVSLDDNGDFLYRNC